MSKTSILIVIIASICSSAICQTKAITENNDTVFIYDDGTWSFEYNEFKDNAMLSDYLDIALDIDTISSTSTYNKKSDKELNTEIKQFKFKYVDKDWKRVPPASINEDAEFAFQHRKNDIWCIIITEETEIGKSNIFKIAKSTMEQNLGGEVTIKKAEVRNVNGKEILRGVLESEMSGMKLIFDSYYYSDGRGTTQITTWTSANLWKKYEQTILDLLNGVIIIEDS